MLMTREGRVILAFRLVVVSVEGVQFGIVVTSAVAWRTMWTLVHTHIDVDI
jgi:hypothetical protein